MVPYTEINKDYHYLQGFGSYHISEALRGAIPQQNSPQKCPYGLYAEKFSGTAFTAPRQENKQTWFYRILPSAAHCHYNKATTDLKLPNPEDNELLPNQIRWSPFDIQDEDTFVSGLRYLGGAGDPKLKSGLGIFIYSCGKNMENQAICSSDGDFLIVPQQGKLDIQTELGKLSVDSGEICVIPRGLRYKVCVNGSSRGYILELYQGHFELPELGPIGSNGLANAKDFEIPVACYEDKNEEYKIICKFGGQFHEAVQQHSPFDVVGWHGTYYPFKYNLDKFNAIGSVSFDHPDPSIYTVLTAQSDHAGTAIADFVIFPPRWLVQEGTFRPPWYHRNTMSEFMGLIKGEYDAKEGGGFVAGGASLHNVMSSHGPDSSTFEKASNAELVPQKIGEGSLAFMFESSLMIGLSDWAVDKCNKVQTTYNEDSWVPLQKHFTGPSTGSA